MSEGWRPSSGNHEGGDRSNVAPRSNEDVRGQVGRHEERRLGEKHHLQDVFSYLPQEDLEAIWSQRYSLSTHREAPLRNLALLPGTRHGARKPHTFTFPLIPRNKPN